jgi:fatty acid desaturase
MNPIIRFIYWNMNYHVEHHMFPLVPYYKLPQLHQICAYDFPAPNTSIFSAYQEMLPALLKQRFNPDFHLRRPLPQTARPYHDGPEVAL